MPEARSSSPYEAQARLTPVDLGDSPVGTAPVHATGRTTAETQSKWPAQTSPDFGVRASSLARVEPLPAGHDCAAWTSAVAFRHNQVVRVLGLTFAGSATPRRTDMARFLRETLELQPVQVAGVEADLFQLPDGSQFAVAFPGGMGETDRAIGFLVDILDEAVAVLSTAGVTTGQVTENEAHRYAHFRAPDNQLYELVERKAPTNDPQVIKPSVDASR